MPLKIIWSVLDLITIVVLVSRLYLWWRKGFIAGEQVVLDGEAEAVSSPMKQRRGELTPVVRSNPEHADRARGVQYHRPLVHAVG